MINENKWVNSLPNQTIKSDQEINQINNNKWIKTIPKKNSYSLVSKYTFMTVLFVCGLLFVSAVKNGTRNLEKEINNLKASVNAIKFDLNQAILDNEVITSPENISRMAKEYLETDYLSYKKSQIRKLGHETESFVEIDKEKNNLSKELKIIIAKKIEKKKTEIKKLKKLYSEPGSIPGEIKIQVARQIEEKKNEIKSLYKSPKENVELTKVKRWAAVQVVKIFLGVPIVPGK